MKQLISTEAQKDNSLSFDNFTGYAAAEGSIIGGMVVAHIALKALKQSDSLVVNGGVAVVGLAGAMMVSNPFIKLALLGVSAYSAIKALNIGVRAATEPGTAGLGFLPEALKSKIRGYLPTISGVESELQGADDIQAALAAIDLGNSNNDSPETIDMGYAEEVSNDLSGVGGALV